MSYTDPLTDGPLPAAGGVIGHQQEDDVIHDVEFFAAAVAALQVSMTAVLGDATWTAATLVNGWTTYGAGFFTPGYRKVNGRIHLRGGLGIGTSTTGTVAFTLPVGYRPNGASTQMQYALSSGPNVVGAVVVKGDGTVTVYSNGSGVLPLDVVNFDTLA